MRMEISELTAEMHCFVETMGWYEHDSPKPQTPRNLAISLAMESTEVLEHFQWGEDIADVDTFSDELADVTLYLLQLASVCGIDLERAVLRKLDLNYKRRWE
ncbi:MAG: nucleotide pyrophosphohydrolase [Anaerolineales bacterium]|nr:nucleotide pyrophosphohydrolase [Anaerolineales bacterium]